MINSLIALRSGRGEAAAAATEKQQIAKLMEAVILNQIEEMRVAVRSPRSYCTPMLLLLLRVHVCPLRPSIDRLGGIYSIWKTSDKTHKCVLMDNRNKKTEPQSARVIEETLKANFGFYSNLYSSAVIISLKELCFYKVEIELESRLEWQFVIYYEKIFF